MDSAPPRRRTLVALRGTGLRYALAVVVVALTAAVRHALDPVWGASRPFMLFFPAIMIAGRVGGFGPGAVATALASLAVDWLWLAPTGHIHAPKNLESFVVFVLSGLLISALNGSLHAALRRAARLHDARETLLAIVAHDLRAPLSAIGLRADTLRRTRSPEVIDKAIATIERSVTRMDRLIGDVLDASRLEAGTLEVVLREAMAGPIVRDAIEASLPVAATKKIDLTSTVPSDLPALLCDPERVLQVLGNLLANAMKLTPDGGTIALTARRAGAFVELGVTDSGPGIDSHDLAHVFERYWRKSPTGTGLGLYIVHGLVKAQGGRTWARSEPGHGATFVVALPIAER
jgi:signal transduction histidine kinase